jgi:hypothetical protein
MLSTITNGNFFDPPQPVGFTLWFRRIPRDRWQEVATASTETKARDADAAKGSGDYLVLPAGETPDRRRRRKASCCQTA